MNHGKNDKEPEERNLWLAAIVESSDDAIIGKTLDGAIISWNKGAELIYGYTFDEVREKNIAVLIPDGLRAEMGEILKKVKDGEQVAHHETVRIAKDGRHIPMSMTVSPMLDSQGKIVGASSIGRDITLQKETEEKLKLAGTYNRSLIEASLDPLVTIGPEGRITDVNEATETATGYSRDKLIGTDFCDYFADPGRAQAGYRQVFQEGSVRDYPLELRHKSGQIMPVLYNASVYRDGAGKVIGVFAAARDITVQKQAMERLSEQQKAFMDVSVPVVRIWSRIILVPLIGVFDSKRAQLLTETLLAAIEEAQAKIAILDISGIPVMDTLVAKHLLSTVAAARLMGTECLITGIKASISQTLVNLGIDLSGVVTKTTLDEGIRHAFAATSLKVVAT